MRRIAIARRRSSLALAAALALVVEAVLMAASLGLHAAPPAGRDAWGGALCVTSAHAGAGDHRSDRAPGGPADCCKAGCNLATGGPPLPEPGPVFAALHGSPSLPAPPAEDVPTPAERSSVGSRGPPRLV